MSAVPAATLLIAGCGPDALESILLENAPRDNVVDERLCLQAMKVERSECELDNRADVVVR
jgi:hypothetical protein